MRPKEFEVEEDQITRSLWQRFGDLIKWFASRSTKIW